MLEFSLSVPAAGADGSRPEANVTDYVVDNALEEPHRVAVSVREGDRWRDVSSREFLGEATAVAKGLIAAGIGAGDRIGLLAKTRYEWTLLDFAVWFAGAVSVPVYETSAAEQVEWILGDSGAVACFVESPQHAETITSVRGSLPGLRSVWCIDDDALATLATSGREVSDEEIARRRGGLTRDSLATIIYTSGTTGRPKGCELTHGNFRAEIDNIRLRLPEVLEQEGASLLLFLPLAHVLARVVEVLCIAAKLRLGHCADPRRLLEDLGSFQPSFLLAVPRVFEKVYNTSEQKAVAAGKGRVFAAAARTAIAYSEGCDDGKPGPLLRARHAVFDRLVYGRLRAALGGRVRYAISGGASLGERLGHFYRGIGLVVLEGYGLTETTAAAAVNTPEALKLGTVGQPLPGVGIRIAEDGEVLFKGGIVFAGYHNNPDATREAFDDDGWFRSGDLGELDADGFLRITGRKKEILVTAGGKNVAPAALEDRLRAHPLVSQCMVVGDGQPYIAALLTLDPEALPGWLEARGLPAQTVDEAVRDPAVVTEIQSAIDAVNRTVSRAESIRRFQILPVDFTEENGKLTPSLKLRRGPVLAEYASEIDAMYS